VYSRYSDDIIISSINKDDIDDIASKVDEILQQCFAGKLKLNPIKSKFTHVGRKIKLLGMVILPNGKVTVDIKFKNNIEVLLHFYISDKEKFLDKVDGDMTDGMERITGYLNYVNAVDKTYLDKIRKKFGSTIVDSFLHQQAK
jgi:RNA-directed DNA polymerase